MSVSSSSGAAVNNIYSSIAAKNNGLGGLVSGLDTDSLVEAMTLNTRSKIAKQQQSKTLLQWKQSAYRGVADALTEFKNKYFDSSSSSSMTLSSFYNVYAGTSSSSAVSVKTNSTSSTGSFDINSVYQLATSKQYTTDAPTINVTGYDVDLTDQTFKGKTLTLQFAKSSSSTASTYTIKLDKLDEVAGTIGPADDENDIAEKYRAKLQEIFDDPDIGFGTHSNGDSIVIADFAHTSGSLGTNDAMYALTLTTRNESDLLNVKSLCRSLGMSDGLSNRLNTESTLEEIWPDLVAAGPVDKDLDPDGVGRTLHFEINGTMITARTDEPLWKVLQRINLSAANVNIEYDETVQKFTITANTTGAGNTLSMQDYQGSFLNQVFGVQGGSILMTDTKVKATFGYDSFVASKSFGSATPSDYLNLLALFTNLPSPPTLSFGDTSTGSNGNTAFNFSGYAGFMLTINGVEKYVEVHFDEAAYDQIYADMAAWVQAKKDSNTTYKQEEYNAEASSLLRNYIVKSFQTAIDDAFDGEAYCTVSFEEPTDSLGNGTGYHYLAFSTYESSMSLDCNQSSLPPSAPGTGWVDLFDSSTGAVGALHYAGNSSVSAETAPGVYSNVNPSTTLQTLADYGVTANGSLTITVTPPSGAPYTVTIPYAMSDTLQDLQNALLSDPLLNPPPVGADANSAVRLRVSNGAIILDAGDSVVEYTDSDTSVPGTGLLNKVFGVNMDPVTSTYTYGTQLEDPAKLNLTQGTNAEIYMNGEHYSSTTNDFNVNGVTITVHELFNVKPVYDKSADPYEIDLAAWYANPLNTGDPTPADIAGFSPSDPTTWVETGKYEPGDKDESVKIDVNIDYTEFLERMQEFVKDYNAMYSIMSTAVYEGKAGIDEGINYTPLTDEQKAEMTEKQIEDWEAKAKQGILANDSTLLGIMDSLRMTIYKTVDASGLAPYEIGLTTKSLSSSGSVVYSESGLLELDPDKLLQMLEANSSSLINMFRDSENGLVTQMNNILDRAVNTSSISEKRGSLISLAGTTQVTGDNTSYLGNRIKAIDDVISRLKQRLEYEYNRYWKKFSSLETALSNMETQIGWLADL